MAKPYEVAAISNTPYSLFVAVNPAIKITPNELIKRCTIIDPMAIIKFWKAIGRPRSISLPDNSTSKRKSFLRGCKSVSFLIVKKQYHCINYCIKLLKNVAKHQRKRKQKQQFHWFSLGHICSIHCSKPKTYHIPFFFITCTLKLIFLFFLYEDLCHTLTKMQNIICQVRIMLKIKRFLSILHD